MSSDFQASSSTKENTSTPGGPFVSLVDLINGCCRSMARSNLIGQDRDGEMRENLPTNKERRKNLSHLEQKAFRLANYYFIFQAFIFLASYKNPSNLVCHYRWIPFVVTFLAGYLTFCRIARIAFMYKRTLDDLDKQLMRAAPESDSEYVALKRPWWHLLCDVGCMVLFIAFFVIALIGSWKTTCIDD